MRATKVLLIESARSNGVSFAASLKRKYNLQIAYSGKQGLSAAQTQRPDVIVLDAVSLRTSGDRICAQLRKVLGDLPIIHIRSKEKSERESAADVLLSPPFTARKLINRIERFAEDADAGVVLAAGGFSLNVEQQTLITPQGEKKLTPKLVALMELFIRNPNHTLARKDIMRTVWKTDYMGDTRTLDVHIRWLRKVVEPNPRKPQFITTVRGVGYQFVVDNQGESATAENQPEQKQPVRKIKRSSKPRRKPASSSRKKTIPPRKKSAGQTRSKKTPEK